MPVKNIAALAGARIKRFIAMFSRVGARPKSENYLSVGITKRGVTLVQLAFEGGKPRVLRCECHEGSEVSAEFLISIWRDLKLGKQPCATLLASGEYQLLLVDAPKVDQEELKTALRWKIKDSLNCPVEEALVDGLKIPLNKNMTDRAQTLYAVAVHNDLIKKRMKLFEQAQLPLVVIDIPEAAQRNIAALYEQEGYALALLSFNEMGGLLTFSSAGELYLTRRIEISSGQLSDADDALRDQYYDRVEMELQRSLDYFDRQFNHLPVSRVLLCAQDCSGLLAFMKPLIDVPLQNLSLSEGLDVSAVPALNEMDFAAQVLLPLGLALRQEAHSS
jgi:MSHA biogenesis protein MshI